MKAPRFYLSCFLAAFMGSFAFAQHASAEDQTAEVQPVQEGADRWHVIVSPRYEESIFIPHLTASSYGAMNVGGATVFLVAPDPRFAVSGNVMIGNGDVHYIDAQRTGSLLAYNIQRYDGSVEVVYTPRESSIRFIGGVRYVYLKFHEQNQQIAFDSHYDNKLLVAEFGALLLAKLTPESRHEFSAQALAGVGYGSYGENTTGTGMVSTSGLGLTGEFSLGYSYRVSSRLGLGVRGRLFLFVTQPYGGRLKNQFGERAGLAVGPELKLDYAF
ncbi:MAG TPA: hypothetical protein VKQ54_11900 [Caulobacteraceae bacterium]|nr:hypothetical protein [Caulobacteraceae bacterium]